MATGMISGVASAPLSAADMAAAGRVIAAHLHLDGAALPILHALQEEFGYVPRECEPMIADALNISRAEVHGTITFYHDFRRAPAGRHVLKLCQAESCQSTGGVELAARLLGQLGLAWGGTTPDGSLTVEHVYCLGLCACSPNALLDGEPLARLDDAALAQVVQEARAA